MSRGYFPWILSRGIVYGYCLGGIVQSVLCTGMFWGGGYCPGGIVLDSYYTIRHQSIIIIIMLAYLYCAAYTRMTMNESSPPCEQRRITFNDDGQRVQLARLELPAPHYICMYRLLPTTLPTPSRHYYLRLIAGTN